MRTLWQDLRYGARMLTKNPGFTLIAVTTLALGIGANAAIFSVVNAVLLRPLPFKDPGRLVWVWGTVPKFGQANHSPVEFLAYQAQQTSFTEMAAYRNMPFTVTGGAGPEYVQGMIVSPNYFSLLGVPAARGRVFQPEDVGQGAPRLAVVSYGLWQKRYGGDPSLIGRSLTINGESATVIGVMPPNFQLNLSMDLWLSPSQMAPDYQMNYRGDTLAMRENHYLRVMGRLKPGATVQQAQADLNAVAARLEQQYPDQAGHGARVVSLQELAVSDVRLTLLTLFGAVGLVLLIACANVTNLSLARATARYREIAIRAAVGTRRFSLIRQLLTESVLLSLAGGLAGWLLASWGVELLLSLSPEGALRLQEARLDTTVFLFTLSVSMAAGVVSGLAPALAASKTDLVSTIKDGARGARTGVGRNRLRQGLVVAEVALALVVLIGAGLLVGSFARLTAVKPGFDPNNLMTMWIALTGERYGTVTANTRFIKELTASLEALPGARGVAISDDFPIQGTDTRDYPEIEGRRARGSDAGRPSRHQPALLRGDARPACQRPRLHRARRRERAAGGHYQRGDGESRLAERRSARQTNPIRRPGRAVDRGSGRRRQRQTRRITSRRQPALLLTAFATAVAFPGHRRPFTDRSGRPARLRAASRAQDRSEPAACPAAYDGRQNGTSVGDAAVDARALQPVCSRGIVAGGHRTLRRDVVRRRATHTRIGHSHCARRNVARRVEVGHRTGNEIGGARPRAGAGRRAYRLPIDVPPAVRRERP